MCGFFGERAKFGDNFALGGVGLLRAPCGLFGFMCASFGVCWNFELLNFSVNTAQVSVLNLILFGLCGKVFTVRNMGYYENL